MSGNNVSVARGSCGMGKEWSGRTISASARLRMPSRARSTLSARTSLINFMRLTACSSVNPPFARSPTTVNVSKWCTYGGGTRCGGFSSPPSASMRRIVDSAVSLTPCAPVEVGVELVLPLAVSVAAGFVMDEEAAAASRRPVERSLNAVRGSSGCTDIGTLPLALLGSPRGALRGSGSLL